MVVVSRSSFMLMKLRLGVLGLVHLCLWSIFMMMVSLSRLSSKAFVVVVHMMLGGVSPFMTMLAMVTMEMWTWTTCACILFAF